MVVRRLDAEERKMIKSGDVHVWEERGPGTEATGLGIERCVVIICVPFPPLLTASLLCHADGQTGDSGAHHESGM